MRARVVGVDATRGLALLGMMAVHVIPTAGGDGLLSARWLSGRSAATFAVLAGVGLALATGGRERPRGRAVTAAGAGLVVRAVLICAIGLALGYADSGLAVILAYYGILFVLAIPLLPLRPAAAAVVALLAATALPVVSFFVRDELPERTYDNPTFADVVDAPGRLLAELTVVGYYPALVWLAYLAAGLAAGRLDLRDRTVQVALAAGGAALAVVGVLASRLLLGPLGGREEIAEAAGPGLDVDVATTANQYGNVPTDTVWWLAVVAPHSSTPLDMLQTIGSALAALGVVLLLARRVAPVLAPLAAAGTMTLTLYSAHVLLVSSDWLPSEAGRSYVLQAVGALLIAWGWHRFVGRGPLEAVIAALARVARNATSRPEREARSGSA